MIFVICSNSWAVLFSFSRESKIPYEDYIIIGDTAEINRIINTCGHINLNVDDVQSTLSTSGTNYVTTGYAAGSGCIVIALQDALDKLPIKTDSIGKLLFNIWMPKINFTNEIQIMTDFMEHLSSNIDIIWGCAFDDSLSPGLLQVKISLIAASK